MVLASTVGDKKDCVGCCIVSKNKNVRVPRELMTSRKKQNAVSANRCHILIEIEHEHELVLPCCRRALDGKFGLWYVGLMIG